MSVVKTANIHSKNFIKLNRMYGKLNLLNGKYSHFNHGHIQHANSGGGGSPPFPSQAGTSVQDSKKTMQLKLDCKSSLQVVLLRFRWANFGRFRSFFSHKKRVWFGLFLGSLLTLFAVSIAFQVITYCLTSKRTP